MCCDIIFLLENNGYLAKSRLYSLVVVQDCGYAAIRNNTPRDGSGPRGLWFESRHSDQKQLELLLRNVDETHLLYGSDMPYTNLSACFGQMEALENTQKLTEHQKQLMFTDTEPIRADTKSEQHTV